MPAGAFVQFRHQLDDRDPQLSCDSARIRHEVILNKQRFGVQIREVKRIFRRAIIWIERRSSCPRHDRKECDCHFRTVWHDNRNAVVARNACPIECCQHTLLMCQHRTVVETSAFRIENHRGMRRDSAKLIK